jgi:hypothetical protein
VGATPAPTARRGPTGRSDRGVGPGRVAGARPRRSCRRGVRPDGRRGWGRWRRATRGVGDPCAGR